jgi:hypothetical protein
VQTYQVLKRGKKMTEIVANTLALNTNTVSILISIIFGIVVLMVGKKYIYKKHVGRDDNSIKIKDSDIKDSFNGKR